MNALPQHRPNYLPSLEHKLLRTRVRSMQDVLLTVPDLYFCCEVAKVARWALTTLATTNHTPPSSLPPHSLPFERKAASVARSRGGGAFPILFLRYRTTRGVRLVFLAQL